jgi:predicted nucleic acid-binding protein
MTDHCLIDTSAWILALRKRHDPEIKDYVFDLIENDRIVIHPLVKVELLAGAKNRNEFSRLKQRLDALPAISLDEETWEAAQRMAFKLRRKGVSIPLVDTIILASAESSGCTLVHKDRHYDLAGPHLNVRLKSFA